MLSGNAETEEGEEETGKAFSERYAQAEAKQRSPKLLVRFGDAFP
jgi:hypothetical protein